MKKLIYLYLVFMALPLMAMRPIPWLNEGAVEFLDKYLSEHPDAKILEFGSGASTIWIAKRNKI